MFKVIKIKHFKMVLKLSKLQLILEPYVILQAWLIRGEIGETGQCVVCEWSSKRRRDGSDGCFHSRPVLLTEAEARFSREVKLKLQFHHE